MSFHQKSSYANNLALNSPRFWNNFHVLFLRFQRDRCDVVLQWTSLQMTEPVFNDRSCFCVSLGAFGFFSPANTVHAGFCSWNLMKGVVGGGHCSLFSGSCAPCHLSPTFWWLVRSRSGLQEQCLFIRGLLCPDSKGKGKAGLKHQSRLDIVLRLLVGQCFLGLIYCGHIIFHNLCKAHYHSNQTGIIAWRLAYINKNKNHVKNLLVMYDSVKAY